MRVTVFLGPTLAAEEALALLPSAVYRPPAAQGDVLAAIDQDRPDLIALIDGTFHQNLSVWHNEILYALSRGVTVMGSSSMGALRAVETEAFGTVGIGQVFRWYRDGVVTGDDEVALLHGDTESRYVAMTMPLVNIRASLDSAVARSAMTPDVAVRALESARSVFYADRTVPAILEACLADGLPATEIASVDRSLTVEHVDIKGTDARDLLRAVSDIASGSTPAPAIPPFEFARSSVFEALYHLDRHMAVDDVQIPLQAVAEHVGLHHPSFDGVRQAALDREIISYFGILLGLRPTFAEVEDQRGRFLAARALAPADVPTWLHENAMSDLDLQEMLGQQVIIERLRQWIATVRVFDHGVKPLLDELRREGTFTSWAQAAADESVVADAYASRPEYSGLRTADSRRLAVLHAENTGVHVTGNAAEWASEHAFESTAALVDGLRRAVLYADVSRRIDERVGAIRRLLEAGAPDDSDRRPDPGRRPPDNEGASNVC